MNLGVSLLGTFLFLAAIAFVPQAEGNCVEDSDHPPCGGAPGRCSINWDGSEGGFVAGTAVVETCSWICLFDRNVPYIAKTAQVCDAARISGGARILDYAQVYGNARVYGNASVSGNARVFGDAEVFGSARVFEYAQVYGHARIYGNATIALNASVFDAASVSGQATVTENAQVFGTAWVVGHSWIAEDELVSRVGHVFQNYEEFQKSSEYVEVLKQDQVRLRAYGHNQITDELQKRAAECLRIIREERDRSESDQTECPICLSSFSSKLLEEALVYTPCQHFFCKSCLNQAYRRKTQCPICRKDQLRRDRFEIEHDLPDS